MILRAKQTFIARKICLSCDGFVFSVERWTITITFSLEKEQIKYLFINKHNYISEVFKKLWSATNKWQISKWALDSAIVSSMSLFHFYHFQGFYHSFVYVNVFLSCRYILSYLIVPKVVFLRRNSVVFWPTYWFWKILLAPNDFFILNIIYRK